MRGCWAVARECECAQAHSQLLPAMHFSVESAGNGYESLPIHELGASGSSPSGKRRSNPAECETYGCALKLRSAQSFGESPYGVARAGNALQARSYSRAKVGVLSEPTVKEHIEGFKITVPELS